MSRAGVTSAFGVRAAQAGPSRIRPTPPSPSTSAPRPARPPPRDPPKPIQYARLPPGIVQIPHPALDPSLGSTKFYVQISNLQTPSFTHLFAVSRAIEEHFKIPVVALDVNMNPELILPYTALYVTLLRPVKLEKPLSLLTRQPRITAKDVDLFGPSLEDVRAVLDSTAEVEDVHGDPGPLASLDSSTTMKFKVTPSIETSRRIQSKPQSTQYFPSKVQAERGRMRQEKQAEDMKIYAVVEQLARSSSGEFDNVLSKFRHLRPAPGPDAERVAKELALLRHRELTENAPKPGWDFTLDERNLEATTASAEAPEPKEDPPTKGKPEKRFSLSALSELPPAAETTDPASPSEVPLAGPSSTALSHIPVAKPRSTKAKSTKSSSSVRQSDTPKVQPTETQAPIPPEDSSPESEPQPEVLDHQPKAEKVDKTTSLALQIARKREQDRLEAEAVEEEKRALAAEGKRVMEMAARERHQEGQAEDKPQGGLFGAFKGLLGRGKK